MRVNHQANIRPHGGTHLPNRFQVSLRPAGRPHFVCGKTHTGDRRGLLGKTPLFRRARLGLPNSLFASLGRGLLRRREHGLSIRVLAFQSFGGLAPRGLDRAPLRRVGRDQRQWRYLTPCTGLQQYAQWPGARPASPLQWRWPSGPQAGGARPGSGSFTGLLRQLARPEGPGEDCSAGTDVPTWGRLINKLLDHSWEVAPSHALKSGNIGSLAFWTRLRGFLTAEYLLGAHSLQKGFGASLQFEMANGLLDIARDDWTATTGFDPEDLDVSGVRGTLQRIAASRLAVFGMSAEDPAPLAAPRPQRGVTPRPDGEREGQRVLLIDVIRPSAAAL